MRIVTALLLLLCCRDATAQVFMIDGEIKNCTPINCRVERTGGSSACIGHIGDDWYFLTAGHCLSDAGQGGVVKSEVVYIQVAIDAKWQRVDVVSHQWGNGLDLGLLKLTRSQPLRCLPIATRRPSVGTEALMGGFPSRSPYAELRGKIVADTGSQNTGFGVSTACIRGMSGGPIICNHEIVGVISESDYGARTWSTDTEKIRSWVMQSLGQLPDCGGNKQKEYQAHEEGRIAGEPEQPQKKTEEPPLIPPAEERSGNGQIAGRVAGGLWSTAWGVLMPLLGLGGPIGMGIGAAGWLISRKVGPAIANRVEKRLHPDQPQQPQYVPQQPQIVQVPVPVSTDTPPPPQQVVQTTKFYPVQIDPRGPAYDWAKRELIQKYPDSHSAIEVLESYMQQFRDTVTQTGRAPI